MLISFVGLTLALAGFMAGFILLQSGLGAVAGTRWQDLLTRLAATPPRGLVAGTAITAFLQSSSLVTAVTVSLAGTRVLSLEQALGIILGSNIGTSFSAQLLAFHPGRYAVLPLLTGLVLLYPRWERYRSWGLILTGLGLLYASLSLASWAAIPLSASWPGLLTRVNVESGFLFGALATAFLQSSSVIIALTMSLAEIQLLNLPTAVAVMLGANVGTCFTALLAGWASTCSGRQVALAHILLNLSGGLLLLPFCHQAAAFFSLTAASPARQVANAHLLYNVASSLMALPFTPAMARLLRRGGE